MHEMDTQRTLEVLHRARASLTTGPFEFHDWTRCTCGHIYAGAAGSTPIRRRDVRSPRPDTAYATAIVDVALALSRDERRFGSTGRPWYDRRPREALAARWVSDYTMRRSRLEGDTVKRADAIAVIDEAIARVEAAEVEQRMALPDVHEQRLLA